MITIGKSICHKRVYGSGSGSLFLIAPFPDLCLPVLFYTLIYITDFVCFESLKLHYSVDTFQTVLRLAVLMFRFFYVPFVVGSHFQ